MNEKLLYAANLIASRFLNAGSMKLVHVASIQRILVVKWDEIGDMAAAVHVFALIRASHPEAEITVLCKPFVASLLGNHPAISKVITHEREWQERYDVVIELRGTWGTLQKSLHWKTMPKCRFDRGWIRFKQRGNQPHELLTNYRVIEPLLMFDSKGWNDVKALSSFRKIYPAADNIDHAERWKEWALEGSDTSVKSYVVLHTGARSPLRRWSTERFVKLSQWLLNELNLMPIWVGTNDEVDQISEAMKLGGAGKAWIAGTVSPESLDLLSFYAFISKAALYVGNESGPLQLADMADIPTVAIYGPGVPRVFYPVSNKSEVLHHVLACNPCDQQHCSQPHDRCVDRVELAQVKVAILRVLSL